MTTNIPPEHDLTSEEYYRSMGVPVILSGLSQDHHAPQPRSIYAIADDIRSNWPNPYFGAVPYLKAMLTLSTMKDRYYGDSAQDVIIYFLANAHTFRGEDARRLKIELNALLKMPTV